MMLNYRNELFHCFTIVEQYVNDLFLNYIKILIKAQS
jgi:hypothetical protein